MSSARAFFRLLSLLTVTLAATACGGKTALDPQPRGDGGVVAPDGGEPAVLEVLCGRRLQFTTPRLPHAVAATIEVGDAPLASSGWSLLSGPPTSMATVLPAAGPTATLDQQTLGLYELRFEARDTAGSVASCEVTVESIVGPPRALCPEERLVTGAGTPLEVVGAGFDDIRVDSYLWLILGGPGGATLQPGDAPVTVFRGDTRGIYELQLTVTDEDGASNSCLTQVEVVGPPAIDCPPVVTGRSREEVRVAIDASDTVPIVRGTYELLERPAGSRAAIGEQSRRADTFEMTFTPDRFGTYVARLEVENAAGLVAECVFPIEIEETGPEAICPPPVDVRPLTTTNLTGDAIDDGEIVRYRWQLVDAPDGSAARSPTPADAQTTQFTPDIAGEYTLQLAVTDDSGNSAICTTLVRAVNSEGLRVEMFWDTPSTDMDVHLMNPEGTRWRTEQTCYYGNCVPRNRWGGPGEEDDPRLDIDDTDGFGPENINVAQPLPGRYTVAVDAYSGNAGRVTVNIYCGSDTTEPQATFRSGRLLGSRDHFWRVADVTINGLSCSVDPIDTVRSERDSEPFRR